MVRRVSTLSRSANRSDSLPCTTISVPADGVRHLFLRQHGLRHLRVRNGDEGVQLRLVLILFAHTLRQADAAGTDIQSHRGIVDFIVMSHDSFLLAASAALSAANISLYFF